MGIFVNGRARAVRADRLGGVTKPAETKHYHGTHQWECIECKDRIFVGRLFTIEDVKAGGWLNGTRFRSTRTLKERKIVCPEYLPGMDEVSNE